ncbi:MAG: hypothetical protein AAGB51_05000 [Planctomycetota bacterium]
MPTSFVNAVPVVVNTIVRLGAQSFLDVGVGFGKWGHLFREYTDIRASGDDPERYQKTNWRARIDGIEGFAPYLTPAHEYFYDDIMVGDALEIIPRLVSEQKSYDVVMLGDIIEHFEKNDGLNLLDECVKLANRAVIVSTPRYDIPQGAACDNELETHRSVWTPSDFKRWPNTTVRTVKHELLMAVIQKEGVRIPIGRASIHSVPRGPARSKAKLLRAIAGVVEKMGG